MAALMTERRKAPVVTFGGDAVAAEDQLERPVAGRGKCTVSGCDCPSYVEPAGGFDCKRCGHKFSDHW